MRAKPWDVSDALWERIEPPRAESLLALVK